MYEIVQREELTRQLEAYFNVLQAELLEIVKDIKYNYKSVKKYGYIAQDYVFQLDKIKQAKITQLMKLREASHKLNIDLKFVTNVLDEMKELQMNGGY